MSLTGKQIAIGGKLLPMTNESDSVVSQPLKLYNSYDTHSYVIRLLDLCGMQTGGTDLPCGLIPLLVRASLFLIFSRASFANSFLDP